MSGKVRIASALVGLTVLTSVAQAAVVVTSTELSLTTHNVYGSGAFPTTAALSDLTDLGPTDWATWTWSGASIIESRGMDGGVGIGSLVSNRTTGTITGGQASSQFDFTNGTAPNTVGNNVVTGAGLTRGDFPAPQPVFSFSVPLNADGSENDVIVWFSATKLGALNINFFDGATQVGSTLTPADVNGDNTNKFIYKFAYGGADSARPLTVQLSMASGQQGDSQLVIHGAALDATPIPEPSGLAMAGLALAPLCRPRRRFA